MKANLQVKLEDKNRDKVPEAIKQRDDAQWQKFLEEEKIVLDAIDKIKAIN